MAQVKIKVGAIEFMVNGGAEVIAQERAAFTDYLKHKIGEDILAAQRWRREMRTQQRPEPDDTMRAAWTGLSSLSMKSTFRSTRVEPLRRFVATATVARPGLCSKTAGTRL